MNQAVEMTYDKICKRLEKVEILIADLVEHSKKSKSCKLNVKSVRDEK